MQDWMRLNLFKQSVWSSLVLALLHSTEFTQAAPFQVALTGRTSPIGGTHLGFPGAPILNENGQIAYYASLTGGTATNSLFVGTPGAFQSIVSQGMAAPSGGTFSNAGNFVLNSAGQAVFISNISGGSSTEGIFVGSPGSIQAIALQGSAAPAGGNYEGLFSPPNFNSSGKVVFRSNLTGGTSASGFFSGVPGSIEIVALQGSSAPGGGTYPPMSAPPLINDAGQVAFNTISNFGLFAGVPNSIQALAKVGATTPIGGTYIGTSYPALNAAGQVAFNASIIGGPTSGAVFVGQPDSLQTVAQSGTLSPAGGNFSIGPANTPVLNGEGQVAFIASLTGGTSSQGIFLGVPGNVQTVALIGSPAPSGGNYSAFINPILNSAGQVTFTATLSGTGVVAGVNDNALFAGAPGSVVQVVREGEVVDVDPGIGFDLRTVADNGITIYTTGTGGEDGKPMIFNSDGLLVYKLTFTDNSVGIFTSQIGTIPEPSTFGLFAVSGLAFLTLRRRRS